MSKKIMKAEYKGEITIGDSIIPCAVLEDGTRVISENGILSNFGSTGGKNLRLRKKMEKDTGGPVPIFLASKALESFVSMVFSDMDLKPIKYLSNDKEFLGYPADILPKVCDVWLMARDANTLQPSQLSKAKKAEILMRGLAHIGITALVDEATGYQYTRQEDELQKILSAYIADEVAKWQLTFSQEYYKEICRLWNQPYNINSNKRPPFIGNLTNKYVYEPLHNGKILDRIQETNPKTKKGKYKYHFHRHLTENVGREHLKKQIAEVTAFMSISDNKKQFENMFNKKYKTYQRELFDDIEPKTNFDKSLKQAIDYNPKD